MKESVGFFKSLIPKYFKTTARWKNLLAEPMREKTLLVIPVSDRPKKSRAVRRTMLLPLNR